MTADIHDDEAVVVDKSDAVGAWRQMVFADDQLDFGDEVSLVFLLDAA